MTDRIEMHNSVMSYRIDVAGAVPEGDDPAVRGLERALRRWIAETDLASFMMTATSPGVFTYELDHTDTRHVEGVWDATVDPKDPTITIDAPDPWRLDEIFREDLREALIRAVPALGMTGLDVTFF